VAVIVEQVRLNEGGTTHDPNAVAEAHAAAVVYVVVMDVGGAAVAGTDTAQRPVLYLAVVYLTISIPVVIVPRIQITL